MFRRLGAGWRRLPLRVKLVAAMLVLVLVALAGSGVAATTTLRSYLVGQVDAQLTTNARFLTQVTSCGPQDDPHHGLPTNYYVECNYDNGTASDYHHPDSVWPNSRAAIERQMKHLSPEMRKKLTHDNAAALYGLP